jgi:hypothetical protein
MIDTREPSRNYQVPDPANTVDEDFNRLIAALTAIGLDVSSLMTSVAGKAATSHVHIIANVTGLQAALDAKAALAHSHTLDDLSDVNAPSPASLQALLFVSGAWQPVSLAISHVSGLQAALDAKASPTDILSLAIALG